MGIFLTILFLFLAYYGIQRWLGIDESQAIVFTGLALLGAGFLAWFCLFFGLPLFLPFMFLLIPITLKKRREVSTSSKQLLLLALLLVVICGSWFGQSVMMSSSDLPNFLFNVDTPFTLNIIQSIVQTANFPFQSIENLDGFLKYHYGSHVLVAAFTSAFGGRVWNQLFFWIPFVAVFNIAITKMLTRDILNLKGLKQIIITVFLLTCAYQPLYNIFNPQTLKNLLFFNGGYPLAQNVIGSFLAICVFYYTSQIKASRWNIFIAAGCLILLPYYKVPYVPIAALGFGFSVLYLFYQERKAIHLTVLATTTAISAIVLFQFLESSDSEMVISFGVSDLISRHDWFSMLLWLLPIPYFILKKKVLNYKQFVALFFSVPIILLLLVVDIHDENAWQLYSVAPFFSLLALLVFIQSSEVYFSVWIKRAAMSLVSILVAVFLSNQVSYQYRIMGQPEFGHEFADVRLMNAMLVKIPTKQTIVAAVDMRYPAENYKRNNRPFHLALAGHQCLNADITYMTKSAYREKIVAMVEALKSADANDESVLDAFKNLSVTHIIDLNAEVNAHFLEVNSISKTKVNSGLILCLPH